MTLSEWHAVRELIHALWRNAPKSSDTQIRMQHRIVKRIEQADALQAVESYAATGAAFPPEPGQIVAEANAITSPPAVTFDEMMATLFYAKRSPLHPQRAQHLADGTLRPALTVAEQCAELHPLIEAFVAVQTPERLRELPVLHEHEGKWVVKSLREAWSTHVDTHTGRERRAVITGRGRAGLRQLDPLAAAAPAGHLAKETSGRHPPA